MRFLLIYKAQVTAKENLQLLSDRLIFRLRLNKGLVGRKPTEIGAIHFHSFVWISAKLITIAQNGILSITNT